MTNREKVLETANKVLAEVGDVTILVNNAGIMPQHSILKHTEAEIRKCFEINALAHCWMFQAFLPRMIEKNHGHIVALSSIAGLIGFNNLVPYCGSKYAVRGMMVIINDIKYCNSINFVNLILGSNAGRIAPDIQWKLQHQVHNSLSLHGRHRIMQKCSNSF